MSATLQWVHFMAGVIVLAEALNKLERTAPFMPGLALRARFVDGLKALAWALLAIGAAGAIAMPLLPGLGFRASPWMWMANHPPTLDETAVLLGFAVLIIRTRIKEG